MESGNATRALSLTFEVEVKCGTEIPGVDQGEGWSCCSGDDKTGNNNQCAAATLPFLPNCLTPSVANALSHQNRRFFWTARCRLFDRLRCCVVSTKIVLQLSPLHFTIQL